MAQLLPLILLSEREHVLVAWGFEVMMRSRRRLLATQHRLDIERLEPRHLLAAEGLVSHWPLDIRESVIRDEGIGNHDLLSIPVKDSIDSDRGRAIVLTGFPGEVSDRGALLHGFGTAVSVGAWIKPEDLGQSGFAFAISPAGVQIRATDDQLLFNVTRSVSGRIIDNQVAGSFDFENGSWYHIAGSFDGERLVAYVNGMEVGSASADGTLAMDGDIFVGSGWTPDDLLIRGFRGALDDIKLFNRGLDALQIQELAQESSALETSNEASLYDPVARQPVPIDPLVEIKSDRENFDRGQLIARFVSSSHRDGDSLMVAGTEQISVDDGSVFYAQEGTTTKIGEITSSSLTSLNIRLTEGATPVATQALARAIVYVTEADVPETHHRHVSFYLATHEGSATFADRRVVVFGDSNDPVLELGTSLGVTEFIPGEGPVRVDPQIEVGSNQASFDGGSLTISFAEDSGHASDRLAIRPTSSIRIAQQMVRYVGNGPSVTIGEFSGGVGNEPLVIALNDRADAAAMQALARAVTYLSTLDPVPSHPRLVRFALVDGAGRGASDLKNLEIATPNLPPQISVPEGVTSFVEGGPPVRVLPLVNVMDADSPNFGGGSLRVTFAEESAKEGDHLSVGSTEAVSIHDGDLILSLSDPPRRIGEVELIENGQVLLFQFNEHVNDDAAELVARTVLFGNDAANPVASDRFVQFELSDGDGAADADTRRIEVVSVNDVPFIEFLPDVTEFNEGSVPVRVDPRVEVSDLDSPDFGGGKLVASFLEGSRKPGDQLGLTGSEQVSIDGSDLYWVSGGQTTRVAEFGYVEGLLVIEFNQQASVDVVQLVARHVTFGSELDEVSNGTRFVRFALNDGDGGEAQDTKQVRVAGANDEPSVDTSEGATRFDLSQGSVIIDPSIEVGDVDSADFGGGLLSVTLLHNSTAEGDAFAVLSGEGIEVEANRVFSLESAERTLVGELRDASGDDLALAIDFTEHATPAIAQRLARRITFASLKEPSDQVDARFVRFLLSDGDGGSAADTKRIDVTRADDDADGVDDEIEGDAPFGGDGNQDGVPDSDQQQVASFRGNEGRFVTIASPGHTRLLDVRQSGEPDPVGLPDGIEFPVGWFDFQIDGINLGEVTVVTIYLQPGTTANAYYVFGPTPENPVPHWYPFSFDGQTGAKIYGDRIELHYRDGFRGDADLIENGVIVDPGAPVLSSNPWQNPNRIGDVNNDGATTALDALLIINDLARNSTRSLPVIPLGSDLFADLFLDVSGDNQSSALDALRVINLIARNATNGGGDNEWVPSFSTLSERDDFDRWTEGIDSVLAELF